MRRIAFSSFISAASFALASVAAQAAPVAGQGTWETTLQARDINGDSIVDAYYDTALDITWLADANPLQQGETWSETDRVTWSDAVSWVSTLNVYGVTGWTLPTTTITAYGGNGWCDYGLGGHDCGYRPEPVNPMAHLYYVTLGNAGVYYDASQGGFISEGTGLVNTGPFRNFIDRAYWSQDATPDPDRAWDFNFYEGVLNNIAVDHPLFAWATHQGDIAAPVPEPATYAMMLLGVGALVARRRRS